MRAAYPTTEGIVVRNGANLHYEVYENDAPTLLLMPTWQILHSRHWKFQIPYLSRHYRVVTFDPVGNGKSDRPTDATRYTMLELIDDALAVLDETKTKTCVTAGLSMGGGLALVFAALHAERVDGVVAIAPAHPWATPPADRLEPPARVEGERPEGWAKDNAEYYREDWRDFVEFFIAEVCSDPYSTKAWDDSVGWAMDTDGDTIATADEAGPSLDIEALERAVRSLPFPVLIIHGTGDRVLDYQSAVVLEAMLPDAELLTLEGAGHNPMGRYPVKVNKAIKIFVDRVHSLTKPATSWNTSRTGPRKLLYISSPIGLGHARRDVAIAQEVRKLHPDVEIDWLAQDPVTRVLDTAGESIHPASKFLASETSHIEDECGEHALAAFQAIRNMDEILLSNFMLFDEVLEDGQYDLVIGDEAWEVDFHLHENPNLKKTAFAWMTDFVGFLPVESGGERESIVAADYNAQMIEQVERYRRIRDKSIFVGSPADIVPDTFGDGLPSIRSWTEDHFDFSGYVTGFDPEALGDRDELRAELGYRHDEQICIVSVGGSGVGVDLIRRVVESYTASSRAVPDLRMIVVTGPRIDPASMPQIRGVEYLAYVDRLYRHLAVADLAIVQGGLTTTMELTASKVPFIYVPLRDHFEQNFHVRARLERYGAGRRMDYEDMLPDNLAEVISQEIGSVVSYKDVETDGAARAANMIAQLI
jgi:pimeloyl-ACP methyl ester carboxylesterase/predicted glycosyltransferase